MQRQRRRSCRTVCPQLADGGYCTGESVPDGAQHGREEASGAHGFAGGCTVGAVDEERLRGYNNWRREWAQDRTKGRSDGIEEDGRVVEAIRDVGCGAHGDGQEREVGAVFGMTASGTGCGCYTDRGVPKGGDIGERGRRKIRGGHVNGGGRGGCKQGAKEMEMTRSVEDDKREDMGRAGRERLGGREGRGRDGDGDGGRDLQEKQCVSWAGDSERVGDVMKSRPRQDGAAQMADHSRSACLASLSSPATARARGHGSAPCPTTQRTWTRVVTRHTQGHGG